MLKRLEDDLAKLPKFLSWLEKGPAATKQAVLQAKRRMLLRQAPIAFTCLGVFLLSKALGLVESRSDTQFLAQWCATLAVLWPPTFLSIAKSAKQDARLAPPLSRKLRALDWGIKGIAALVLSAMVGTMGIYVYLKAHS